MFRVPNNSSELAQIANKEILIYDNTLSEAVVSILISEKIGGGSFGLRRARLVIYVPANTIANNTLQGIYGRVNGITSASYNSTSIGVGGVFNSGSVRNIHNLIEIDIKLINKSVLINSWSASKGYAADGIAFVNSLTPAYGCTLDDVNIESITSFNLTNMTFPIGTKIKVYGVLA